MRPAEQALRRWEGSLTRPNSTSERLSLGYFAPGWSASSPRPEGFKKGNPQAEQVDRLESPMTRARLQGIRAMVSEVLTGPTLLSADFRRHPLVTFRRGPEAEEDD